jgi:NCAIR mutase (PurE)-related protein
MLASVRQGTLSIDDALAGFARGNPTRASPERAVEDLGFAAVDHDRQSRQGFAEVIFGEGKTPQQIALIAQALHRRGSAVLATRCSPEAALAVQQVLADAVYDELARTIVAGPPAPTLPGLCGIICAGTSDLPVAREASNSLRALGGQVLEISDVGVAGLHRLLARIEEIRACDVLIVAAGMEGALPSVVGGLVSAPVVAVPTSVGYGASFGGLSALLGMLNTCASGVAVMNIDNGFGAAAFAAAVLKRIRPE